MYKAPLSRGFLFDGQHEFGPEGIVEGGRTQYRVAGVVGLMMSHIMGVSREDVFADYILTNAAAAARAAMLSAMLGS